MKTNYEIRYAAHPEDAKSYGTQRIRRDFLIEKVFSDNEVNMVYSMYDRMVVGGAKPVGEILKLEAIDPLKASYFFPDVKWVFLMWAVPVWSKLEMPCSNWIIKKRFIWVRETGK